MKVSNRTVLSGLNLTLILVLMLGLSSEAFAQLPPPDPYIQFCARWKSEYQDAGYGENLTGGNQLNQPGSRYRKAAYSRGQLQIWNNNEWQTLWNGWFDPEGCTPSVVGVSNAKYRLRQGSAAQRDNRRIYVNPPNSTGGNLDTWPMSFVWGNTTFNDIGNLEPGSSNPFIVNFNWESPWANLMPLLGRLLSDPGRFAFSNNSDIRIRVDSGPSFINEHGIKQWEYCSVFQHENWLRVFYVPGTPNICLHGFMDDTLRPDATAWKYVVGHEIGHRIANLHSGLNNVGSYFGSDDTDDPNLSADDPSNAPYCNCDHVSGNYANNIHCLTSRHFAGVVQGEGFAHLFATALWNWRNRTAGGQFVYYKEAKRWDPAWGYQNSSYPPAKHDAWVVNPQDIWGQNPYDRWRNRLCQSANNTDRGVQLDWLKFFWELWTEPDTAKRFSILQMNQVFEGKQTVPARKWDNLIRTDTDTDTELGPVWPLSTTRRWLFEDKGELAGVKD